MELLRSDLPHGSFILPDEIGAWYGARNWMTKDNKEITEMIEIFRQLRLGVVWTVPQLSQVDITLRNMADVCIETVKIHRRINFVETKFLEVEKNPIHSKEPLRKFPRITTPDGLVTVNRLFVDKPPKNLVEAYLEKKKEFVETHSAKIHRGIKDEEGEDEDERKTMRCKKCGYMWKTSAMKPRCSRCDCSIVAVVK